MPERTGHLHEISEAIGEIRGTVGAIEKYIHEERHGIRNLSQKVEAIGTKITGDMAKIEARLETKLDNFKTATEARLKALEDAQIKESTGRNIVVWIIQSPLIAWIAAAAVMVAAWWKGTPQ